MTPEELLTTTRTVRKRLDLSRPVPLDLVRRALTVALQAPSGSNRQTWEWVVVTDATQRARVGAVYAKACAAYLASSGAAGNLFADDPSRSAVQKRVHDSVAYLAERMGDVPVLVIPCLRAKLPAGNQAGLWGSLLVEGHAAWGGEAADRGWGVGARVVF